MLIESNFVLLQAKLEVNDTANECFLFNTIKHKDAFISENLYS